MAPASVKEGAIFKSPTYRHVLDRHMMDHWTLRQHPVFLLDFSLSVILGYLI